jgi:hypothetical protein
LAGPDQTQAAANIHKAPMRQRQKIEGTRAPGAKFINRGNAGTDLTFEANFQFDTALQAENWFRTLEFALNAMDAAKTATVILYWDDAAGLNLVLGYVPDAVAEPSLVGYLARSLTVQFHVLGGPEQSSDPAGGPAGGPGPIAS